MRRRSIASLLAWIALVAVAAALGAFASLDAAAFYSQLVRPAWAPPAWLFGPVWTGLYLLMAIAAWRAGAAGAGATTLALFVAQLAVNALWSWLFFGWHLGAASFADIVLLDALVVATMLRFHRVERVASFLLVPYLAWIAFATALNLAVWRANPGLLG